jgi:hypothetical protein
MDGSQNWMPSEITAHHNGREGLIPLDGSSVAAYVIPTDEELLIAREYSSLCSRRSAEILEFNDHPVGAALRGRPGVELIQL